MEGDVRNSPPGKKEEREPWRGWTTREGLAVYMYTATHPHIEGVCEREGEREIQLVSTYVV